MHHTGKLVVIETVKHPANTKRVYRKVGSEGNVTGSTPTTEVAAHWVV